VGFHRTGVGKVALFAASFLEAWRGWWAIRQVPIIHWRIAADSTGSREHGQKRDEKPLFGGQKCKHDSRKDAHERSKMIPPESLAEIQNGEDAKNYERDDLLNDFKLKWGIRSAAPSIGRYLKAVFQKRDAPTGDDH
jgi:hypothetical protein